MPKLKSGDKIESLNLPAIDNTQFDLGMVQGKRYMICFFRFASCPFCNLRVHELVSRFDEFGDGFSIVAIFDSPLKSLQTFGGRHHAPFPILADEKNEYYKKFGVERSLLRTLKGAILRFPRLLYAMLIKGYLPLPITGNITTMPLDILVSEEGVVERVHYGRDEGDHMPLRDIVSFSKK